MFLSLAFLLTQSGFITSFSQLMTGKKQISIEWQNTKPSGYIEVLNGKLGKISIVEGKGKISNESFYLQIWRL